MKNIENYKNKLKKEKKIKWFSILIAVLVMLITFYVTILINYELKDFAIFLVIVEIGIEVGIIVNQNKKINDLIVHINELNTITESIEDSQKR